MFGIPFILRHGFGDVVANIVKRGPTNNIESLRILAPVMSLGSAVGDIRNQILRG